MTFHDLFNDICLRAEKHGHGSLTQSERQVLAVVEFLVELNGGGLHQYFANSAGDHFADLMSGLEVLGCRREHELLQQALVIFGETGYTTDQDRRHRLLFPLDAEGELDEDQMEYHAEIIMPLSAELQDSVGEIGQRNEDYALRNLRVDNA